MPDPLPDVSHIKAPCKNIAQKMSRPNLGDFIFKLNKLEANPLLIIIFLVRGPIQHIGPNSINCMIPEQSVPGYTVP
jgi:hypothetical protein